MKIGKNAIVALSAVAVAGTGLAAASIGVGGSSTPPVPTLEEATTAVSQAWSQASQEDRDGVCLLASAAANCRVMLDAADGVWPTKEPKIVCDRVLKADGDNSGGQALRVEGVDSTGAAYSTDVLVIGTEGGPRLMNPVFWLNTSIAVGNETGSTFDVCA